jgi:hypothetical protein
VRIRLGEREAPHDRLEIHRPEIGGAEQRRDGAKRRRGRSRLRPR